MNWLAHLLLSRPELDFQLGNLLADLIKGTDRLAFSPAFQQGAACHQAIDAFTDAHPLVLRSRARIGGGYRRFSGILIDVFYDHLLAQQWDRYHSEPLPQFTASLYAAIAAHPVAELPANAQAALHHMMQQDILGSYRHIDGIEVALRRVSARLSSRTGRPFALQDGMPELQAQHAGIAADFAEFFPLLQAHVAHWIEGCR
jgi:acyl carrier protein phosphodiesterase